MVPHCQAIRAYNTSNVWRQEPELFWMGSEWASKKRIHCWRSHAGIITNRGATSGHGGHCFAALNLRKGLLPSNSTPHFFLSQKHHVTSPTCYLDARPGDPPVCRGGRLFQFGRVEYDPCGFGNFPELLKSLVGTAVSPAHRQWASDDGGRGMNLKA